MKWGRLGRKQLWHILRHILINVWRVEKFHETSSVKVSAGNYWTLSFHRQLYHTKKNLPYSLDTRPSIFAAYF
jgi:hypothetical protein